MHLPPFSTLIASLFLFGIVTSAPVPQEDNASLSVNILLDISTDVDVEPF